MFRHCYGLLAAALVIAAGWASPALAQRDDFLGVLALAVEDEVGPRIDLTETQKKTLLGLIEQRENAALELALSLKDAPAVERTKQLDAFRRESEAKAMAALSPQQRSRLEGIRVRRRGMEAATEADVAKRLNLTPEQQTKIGGLARERTERLAKADAKSAQVIRAESERAMAAVLNDAQRTALEGVIAGEGKAGAPPAEGPPRSALPPGAPPAGAPSPAQPSPAQPSATAATPAERPAVPAEKAPEQPVAAPPSAAPPSAAPLAESPVAKPEAAPAEPVKLPDKLRFSFRFQPWGEVLDWFAKQAGLSLVMDSPPKGTFNYTDDREYTPAEMIDVLNSVLLTKGYTLVRRERMLMLVNLEDGIPPNLVETVTPEDLDSRGEFELVRALFSLEKLTAEDAEAEVKKLLGPQGTVVTLPKSRQLLVTETAGRLRTIRRVLARIEDPDGLNAADLKAFDLKYALPEQAMAVLRRLFDIPEDKSAAADGSISFSPDPTGRRILASGRPEKLARVTQILKVIDVAGAGGESSLAGLPPQLQVYPIVSADPQAVLKVMQTLMEGQPSVRLAIDEKTGHLIALARPAEHATIRATLEQLQQDARIVEVIQLTAIDPQVAVLSITKLFGGGKDATGLAPQVDADPTTRQLLIRGTKSQVDQIRAMLEKMGETGTDGRTASGNVRMLPLSGRNARSALERIQEIWPTMSPNKIRVVTPSSVIPTLRPGTNAAPGGADEGIMERLIRPDTVPEPAPATPPSPATPPPTATPPSPAAPPKSEAPAKAPERDKSAVATPPRRAEWAQVLLMADAQPSPPKEEPKDGPNAKTNPEPAQASAAAPKTDENTVPGEPSPIIVSQGPGGIMIASQDVKALDRFEQLFNALASGAMSGNAELTIFYLKHAKAASVAETLDQVLGGGTTASRSGGQGGGLIQDIAGAAMGETGGNLVGALMGMGGGGTINPTGSIRITADPRLNALVVQANSTDLDTIEQLLKILDQKESPEDVLVVSKPRLIPVFNTQAEEVSKIVSQVYQDRMVKSAGGGGNQQPPSPQEFIQMLRGGGGGQRGGRGGGATEDVQKMSVGVDTRTNSLVVVAPDNLFEEVKDLVEQLDQAAIKTSESVRVVTLHRANPATVRQALSAITGNMAQSGASAAQPGATPGAAATPTPQGDQSATPEQRAAEFQRRMEFFRQQGGGGFGGRGGGGGGRRRGGGGG